MTTLILLWLLKIISAEIITTDLTGVTIYSEELGQAQLYHDTWNIILGVGTNDIDDRLGSLQSAFAAASYQCDDCLERFELNLIQSRTQRLDKQRGLLNQLLGKKRNKRGFFNFIGDVSKTLFGTLSENDMNYINKELDKLFKDNTILSTGISNQTKVIKLLLNSATTDLNTLELHSKENVNCLNQLANGTNKNTQNLASANQITVCMMIVDELSEDINLLINAINDGKNGIVHPQLLTPDILILEMKEFEEKLNVKYTIPLKESNFQHIIDISIVNVAIAKNRFVYSIHIPIPETETYEIKHLIPIPKQISSVFLAIIPDYEYLFMGQGHTTYVPTDKTALDTCKTYGKTRMCKRIQPTYLMSETHSCENSILRTHVKTIGEECKYSPFKIVNIAFIPLTSGYILIPHESIEVDALCESGQQKIRIQGPTKITSNDKCILNGLNIVLKLSTTESLVGEIKYKKN